LENGPQEAHVLRFLGIVFVTLLPFIATSFAWAFQQDKSARRYVAAAVPAIFNDWNVDALKQRASEQLNDDPQFSSGASRLFLMLDKALGELKETEEPRGNAGYGWGDASPAQGTYGDYFIRAEFERGPAELRLLVVREHGAWRIRGFNVNSPVLAKRSA
jgi:hypothetical protein